MGEVLETWLMDRLGLMIDISPESFGIATRDGTLLAELLHSYDIIDSTQLKTINATEDPALARVNLKHLRIWLKFIGVDCPDDTIEDISNGRGTTAARLFYKIFVSLESKDKLHFITQRKEREKFIPNSSKFDVTTVSDKPLTPKSENPLADQLCKNVSVISWHRNKFEALLDRCKTARKRDVTRQKQRKDVQAEVEARIDHEKPKVKPNCVQSSIEKEIQDLKDFGRKHEVRCAGEYTYHELCREKKFGEKVEPVPVDPDAAKTYVKCMKDRTRRAMDTFSCKSKMEKELTTKLWERQKQDQESEFDATIANKLFSQSQYEKQMMSKLCEIRDQKRRIARNRELVNKLMQDRIKTEYTSELARENEVLVKSGEDIQEECIRLCELKRRIMEEKIRNSEKKRYQMCEEVLDDLLDIVIKAAKYRESNDNLIPSRIWSEWKALFVKSQPIFDSVEHMERITEYMSEEQVEEIHRAEIERQSILNDDEFENYLNLRTPWNEFVPEIDLETEEILRLGVTVLGYIVHRLLNPLESYPEPASVPKVSSACILLGVLDVDVYPIMETLLKHRGVKLIRVEDAINHCLSCYKEEMKSSAYIDLDKLRSKEGVQRKIAQSSTASRAKKDTGKKQETPAKTQKIPTSPTKQGIDEETQTPHALPDEDMSPDLSNPAYIGKRTHEFLTLGQPIPNELNTKILIEYLKSLTDVKGWVLIDYPNTFDQMARLEMALTGHRIPSEYQSSNDPDSNIDEVDPALSGIPYGDEDEDESSGYTESRLVCNPIPKPVEKNFNSYMTAYIRALPKPKNMLVDETDVYEILPEDTTPVDVFYTDQGLAYAVYYTSFNTYTLKRMCRLVIGDMSIPRVPSEELFGDGLNEVETKEQSQPSKAPVIKQLVPRPETANVDWSTESEYEGEGPEALNDILGVEDAEPIPPKPGEDGWEWIKFPQAKILLEALATLWENMETVYVEDLKEIFFVKRVHYSMIVPYRHFVTKHMEEYIQRPDVKQEMLHTFHTSYNEIEKDLRDDLDVKCELHCRVADFRKELWEVCDEWRNQAEVERQRIISQDWTAEAMVVLANLYISILKAEFDRCIDTMQLLQDYYISMLQRPINENRLLKYPLQRLELIPNELEKSTSTLSPAKVNKPNNKGNKNMTSKGPQAPPTTDCSHMKKQITDLFIISEREPLNLEQLICYEAVHANIRYVQKIVESLESSVMDGLKKEQASFTADTKGRVQITKTQLLPTANDEVMNDLMKRGSQLCQEWRAAVQFEINRTRLRLKILDNAALSDISFLYETMERCFHNMLRSINDRHDREIKSVNDMASVFCFSIEEGIPIQEELLLDGDRFVVRSNVLMYPDPSPISARSELIQEAILPSQFRMGQLGRLMDVFRYVAPHGSLPERCFTHILEDMVTCGDVEGGMAHLPSSWSALRRSDVEKLVLEIFGDSEYIDWREFIIYAMDISMPSEDEILDARSQFLAIDPNLTETVTRDEFHKVNLWFSNCSESRHPSCKVLLHDDWRTDEEEMFEAEQIRSESENTSGLVLPKIPPNPQPTVSSQKSFTNSTFSLNSRNMTPQETVRLMLAKELLCDMFASGCDKVNYTAFLLAFSKSYDPRDGLGKALTLALGEKVCVSEEEGEEFIRQLLEQRQMREHQREAAEKTASNVINDVLETTIQLTEGVTISEIDAVNQCGKMIGAEAKQDNSIQYLDRESSKILGAFQSSSSLRSRSNGSESYEEILTDEYSKHSLGTINEGVIAHWIPRDICQSVLVASLPWHARQPDILGTTLCLRECLGKVYTDIFDPAIRGDGDSVLSHRLVNHEFITNLINSTSVFTAKNMGNIVHNLLGKNSDSKQTLNC